MQSEKILISGLKHVEIHFKKTLDIIITNFGPENLREACKNRAKQKKFEIFETRKFLMFSMRVTCGVLCANTDTEKCSQPAGWKSQCLSVEKDHNFMLSLCL